MDTEDADLPSLLTLLSYPHYQASFIFSHVGNFDNWVVARKIDALNYAESTQADSTEWSNYAKIIYAVFLLALYY